MKKFFKYVGLVVLIAIIGLLIAPFLINVERYKPLILSEVKKATGREATISGAISLSLFPMPKINIKDVKLASIPKAQKPYLLEVQELSLRIDIWPLLRGNFLIEDIELHAPKITLETLASGENNWALTKNYSKEIGAQDAPDLVKKTINLPFRQLKIYGGEIEYFSKQPALKIEKLNMVVQSERDINFNANFTIADKEMTLKGQIPDIAENIPVILELKTLGNIAKLNGNIKQSTLTLLGNITLEGNINQLYAHGLPVNWPQSLLSEYKLSGELAADKEKLNIENIALTIGAIKATGQIVYENKKTSGNLQLSLEPGQVTMNLSATQNAANFWENVINIKSPNIYPLLQILQIKQENLAVLKEQKLGLNITSSYNKDTLNVKNINLQLGNATLQGDFSLKNQEEQSKYTYNIQATNFKTIQPLLSNNMPVGVNDFIVQGEIEKDGGIIKTNNNIFAAKAQTSIKGDVNLAKDTMSLAVSSTGNSLANTVYALFSSAMPTKLGAFSFKGQLEKTSSHIFNFSLKPSTILVGESKSTINGTANINNAAAKPMLNAEIKMDTFDLDQLSGANIGKRGGQKSAKTTGQEPWSHQIINLGFLQTIDGTLNLSIDKLIKSNMNLEAIQAKLAIADDAFKINSLTGNVYNGKLIGEGFISSRKEQPLQFKASIERAQLNNVVPNYNEFKVTKGLFNLDYTINSKGKSQFDYIKNLNGEVNLSASDGSLHGINLQKALDALANLKNLEGVLGLLDNAFAGGDTEFSKLEGKLHINQGIATLDNCKLTANRIAASATGNVDLPNYTLDINGIVQLDAQNAPPLQAKFYGAIDNPQHKLNTAELHKYIIQKLAQSVANSLQNGKINPKDILKGVLGGGASGEDTSNTQPTDQSDDSANSTPPVSPTNDPSQLIKQGFKNLLGG